MSLTIDSWAWVEVIRGTAAGKVAQGEMEGADDCYTPAIVLAEVASVLLRGGIGSANAARELRGIREASQLVPTDERLALAGARAAEELRDRARERGLPSPDLADGLILATARRTGTQLLTGDSHFAGLPEVCWLA